MITATDTGKQDDKGRPIVSKSMTPGAVEPAFDRALERAAAALDVEERRLHMVQVEKILQEDTVITQPFWRSIFSATSKQVQGDQLHPSFYHSLHAVWFA